MNPQPDSFIRGVILLTCVAALMLAAHMVISNQGAKACATVLAR